MNMRDYKIVATLTYGKKISTGLCTIGIISILLLLGMIPLTIICAISSTEPAVLSCLSLPLIGIPGLSYVIFIYLKEHQDIKKWMKDAVLLPAHAMEVDRIENSVNHIIKLKILVKFIYNGQKIIQESGAKNTIKESMLYIHPGYDAIYRKYIDRPINILYSPEFDQVLIIKDS